MPVPQLNWEAAGGLAINAEESAEKEESYLRMIARRFFKHKLAVAGLVFFMLFVIIALFAPFIAPKDPYMITESFESPPSREYWLGTDSVGRDVFSRLIYAFRVSLAVGVGATAISVLIGVVLGMLSGYFGRWTDMVIMRLTDVFMSFPHFMLILVIVSVMGPSLANVIFVLGLMGWPATARLVRGCVLSLKEMEFVKAAIVLGVPTRKLILKHIFPNTVAPILVNATFSVAAAIIVEASLSFLGMGVQPPTASWGNMLTDAQSLTVLTSQPWLWIPPGLMIVIAVLSINFLGDGLRDALDPMHQP